MQIVEHIAIARGPAALDLRAWREFLEGDAYARLQRRIDYMIEAKRKALEVAETPEEWRKAQGAIEALRAVKALGPVIEAEMTNK